MRLAYVPAYERVWLHRRDPSARQLLPGRHPGPGTPWL